MTAQRALAVEAPSFPHCPCGKPSRPPGTLCDDCRRLPPDQRAELGSTRYANDLNELRPRQPEDPFPSRPAKSDARSAAGKARAADKVRRGESLATNRPDASPQPRPTLDALAEIPEPTDDELAAIDLEDHGGHTVDVGPVPVGESWPTLAEALDHQPAGLVGAGLAGLSAGDDGDLRPQGVNVACTGAPEGSGPAPTIPPPWEQDGPPYRCDAPGCEIERDTLQSVCTHRVAAHGLRPESPAARQRRYDRRKRAATAQPVQEPQAPVPADIGDLGTLLLGAARQPVQVGLVRVWMEPRADGLLAVMAQLVEPT